ncbi:MAG: tRNA pseudouridine(55) synthase TruB [Chlamydia sp.]
MIQPSIIPQGVLLLDKTAGKSSFHFVHLIRKKTGVQKVGHAGTLDPFASGLLILLVGKAWTRKQDSFMGSDKEYLATITLGVATDSYDRDGSITATSSHIPTLYDVEECIRLFQGEKLQTPPMYSAKKIAGVRLYELARKGIEIERKAVSVHLEIELISYVYPNISIRVRCSKGTYIRSLGHEIGEILGSYGHVDSLRRTKSGIYSVDNALSFNHFSSISSEDIVQHLFCPLSI